MSSTLVCTGRLFHESDHELVVSALRFKIKGKHRHTGTPCYRTTNVSTSHQAGYQSVLAEAYDMFDQTSSINTHWDSFKSSVQKACESLPHVPPVTISDSVTPPHQGSSVNTAIRPSASRGFTTTSTSANQNHQQHRTSPNGMLLLTLMVILEHNSKWMDGQH